jgi:hypothetical protein
MCRISDSVRCVYPKMAQELTDAIGYLQVRALQITGVICIRDITNY